VKSGSASSDFVLTGRFAEELLRSTFTDGCSTGDFYSDGCSFFSGVSTAADTGTSYSLLGDSSLATFVSSKSATGSSFFDSSLVTISFYGFS
jgi:hypothetical protein